MECGVPLESCLPPTLFSLYFSDITKIIPAEVKIALYEDELFIWYTGSSKREIKTILQKLINAIATFCKKCGLTKMLHYFHHSRSQKELFQKIWIQI